MKITLYDAKMKVLLVDDDENVRSLTSEVLRKKT